MSVISYSHPFKQGVVTLLKQHFSDDIVAKFILSFESELYRKKDVKDIFDQVKNDKMIMEVHYNTGKSLEYICDLYSWEKKQKCEVMLLSAIQQALKNGKIGQDWGERNGKIAEGGESK